MYVYGMYKKMYTNVALAGIFNLENIFSKL